MRANLRLKAFLAATLLCLSLAASADDVSPRQRFDATNSPVELLHAMTALANVAANPEAQSWREITNGNVLGVEVRQPEDGVTIYLFRGAKTPETRPFADLLVTEHRTIVRQGDVLFTEKTYDVELLPVPAARSTMPFPPGGVWSGS